MSKVVEDQKAAWPDLCSGGIGVSLHTFIGMICVDVDPVKAVIGEGIEHFMRISLANGDPRIASKLRAQGTEVEIDQMKL